MSDNALQSYESQIAEINARDMATGFDIPKLFATIQKNQIVISTRGNPVPLKTYSKMTVQILAAIKSRGVHIAGLKVPECASSDGGITGHLTRVEAAEITGLQNGQSCFTCRYNKFGSAVDKDGTPGKGKRCPERRNLLVLHEDWSVPLVLSLSSTSTNQWDAYAGRFVIARPPGSYLEYSTLVSIEMVARKNNPGEQYGVVRFTQLERLAPEQVMQFIALRQTYENMLGTIKPEETDEAQESEPVHPSVVEEVLF